MLHTHSISNTSDISWFFRYLVSNLQLDIKKEILPHSYFSRLFGKHTKPLFFDICEEFPELGKLLVELLNISKTDIRGYSEPLNIDHVDESWHIPADSDTKKTI